MKPVTVLYVEDEESDAIFMDKAFEQAAPGVQLRTVADGQQAVDYLAGRKGYSERAENPLPSLVLLDLKLPVLSGFEVLRWIRQEPQFKSLPVVVFSSSPDVLDKKESDELGANGYMQKPSSAKQFCEVVEQLKQRWLLEGGATGSGAGVERVSIRMRKLVQNRSTKELLTEDGSWTRDWRRAREFARSEEARAAVLKYGFTDVELYYLFGEEVSKYDFTISLLYQPERSAVWAPDGGISGSAG